MAGEVGGVTSGATRGAGRYADGSPTTPTHRGEDVLYCRTRREPTGAGTTEGQRRIMRAAHARIRAQIGGQLLACGSSIERPVNPLQSEGTQPIVRAPEWVRSDERPAALHRVDGRAQDVRVASVDVSVTDSHPRVHAPRHEYHGAWLTGNGAQDGVGHRLPPDRRVSSRLPLRDRERRVQQEDASPGPLKQGRSP